MVCRRPADGGDFLFRATAAEDIFAFEELSATQRMIHAAARDFMRREILPAAERIERREAGLIPALIAKAGALGLIGLAVPERLGGAGFDEIAACLAADAFGGAASFAVAHAGQEGIGALPLLFFGSDGQRRRYLPAILGGRSMAAYCLTEAGAGSDALACRTAAEPQPEGGYRLHGEKLFVSNGAWAALFVVFAAVRGRLCAFLVERGSPGLSVGPEERKLGLHGASTTAVRFAGCPVAAENLLLGVGQGHRIAFSVLHLARARLAAANTGAGKTALSLALRYAQRREQFGRPIARFGLIQAKLAGMVIRTYLSESLAYRLAAALADRLAGWDRDGACGGPAVTVLIAELALECAAAKVFASEALDWSVDELLQIHGGYGFTGEGPVQRLYRDSRVNRIFEGTNEINRLLVAGSLFKLAGRRGLPLAAELPALDRALGVPAGDPAGEAAAAVEICRQLVRLAAGAMLRAGAANGEEQELAAWLADMLIATYAAESGLLRAIKRGCPALCLTAVRLYLQAALPRLIDRAGRILRRVGGGGGNAALLQRIAAAPLLQFDAVGPQRAIAERALAAGRYPFNGAPPAGPS